MRPQVGLFDIWPALVVATYKNALLIICDHALHNITKRSIPQDAGYRALIALRSDSTGERGFFID